MRGAGGAGRTSPDGSRGQGQEERARIVLPADEGLAPARRARGERPGGAVGAGGSKDAGAGTRPPAGGVSQRRALRSAPRFRAAPCLRASEEAPRLAEAPRQPGCGAPAQREVSAAARGSPASSLRPRPSPPSPHRAAAGPCPRVGGRAAGSASRTCWHRHSAPAAPAGRAGGRRSHLALPAGLRLPPGGVRLGQGCGSLGCPGTVQAGGWAQLAESPAPAATWLRAPDCGRPAVGRQGRGPGAAAQPRWELWRHAGLREAGVMAMGEAGRRVPSSPAPSAGCWPSRRTLFAPAGPWSVGPGTRGVTRRLWEAPLGAGCGLPAAW